MNFLDELENINHAEISIFRDKDLTSYSTMRLKARGNLIEVRSKEALIFFQKLAKKHHQKFKILGMGANQPLAETQELPYLKLNFSFDRANLAEVRDEYILPASLSLAVLTSTAAKLNLAGWERFTGVPATLGGAIAMNAGTGLGEIGSVVKNIFFIDENGLENIHQVSDDSFTYRGQNFLKAQDVVYQVTMIHEGVDPEVSIKIKEYLNYRNKTQPMGAWTCGCMFKNYQGEKPCRAGESIDIIGLKGMRYKNLRISPIHANFLENLGGATLEDVKEFTTFISDELYKKFGVRFELELRL